MLSELIILATGAGMEKTFRFMAKNSGIDSKMARVQIMTNDKIADDIVWGF